MKLLQLDFPYHGPDKQQMDQTLQELAQSIADYPGLIWKIWTVNSVSHEGGGIYLFEDVDALDSYLEMHRQRLQGMGVTTLNAKVFDLPPRLTAISRGCLTRQPPQPITSSRNSDHMRLLQMDFPYRGPGQQQMEQSLQPLAQSIADYPGVIWKIWTLNEHTHQAGGIYLFENEEALTAYVAMHRQRLGALGVEQINAKVFEVPQRLTAITRGPIPRQG